MISITKNEMRSNIFVTKTMQIKGFIAVYAFVHLIHFIPLLFHPLSKYTIPLRVFPIHNGCIQCYYRFGTHEMNPFDSSDQCLCSFNIMFSNHSIISYALWTRNVRNNDQDVMIELKLTCYTKHYNIYDTT